MTEEQKAKAAEIIAARLNVEHNRLNDLQKAIEVIHPAGVQYYYNRKPSNDGIYLLAPLVYSLVVQTLYLKKANDGKWYGDFKLNRATNPYNPEKPIKAELQLTESYLQLSVGKDIMLHVPKKGGKQISKPSRKVKEPETYAQLMYAKSMSDMFERLSKSGHDISELPISEQLAVYSQLFAKMSENLVLFGLSQAYPELTPAYVNAYNMHMQELQEQHIAQLKAEREAEQQAQAQAAQAGSDTDEDSE
jgi:hypothetical protein